MLEELKREANFAFTENGAAAYATTGSECLDLFATIGALRRESGQEICTRFFRAYAENADLAMKLLFFARDVRGGLGERRVFRTILRDLAYFRPDSVRKNLPHVAEFGRFDDLLVLLGTPCEREMLALLKEQLHADRKALEEHQPVSLLGKWLPSVNASNANTRKMGKKLARAFGQTEEEYRKMLTALRREIRILENYLRERDYTFDYEKQPSKALFQYRAAFARNDEARYKAFLAAVSSGNAVLNAKNVAPYELVEPYLADGGSAIHRISSEEAASLNATWASLPDFESDENLLAVVDTSGSMYYGGKPLPAAVALSLGIYIAEHNHGKFQNHFIEFSARPQLIEIKGATFAEKLRYVESFNEIANTNLEAVFDLILDTAVQNHLQQQELPAKLVMISDMEFDACVENASAIQFQNAAEKYRKAGYQLPQVVFWNVASRNRQQPVTQNDQGAILVSGVTPRIFSMIAGGKLSPYAWMIEVLTGARYAQIAA